MLKDFLNMVIISKKDIIEKFNIKNESCFKFLTQF